LLGNHDAAALGILDSSWFNPVAKMAIQWTGKQLSAENRAWLHSLQPTLDKTDENFGAVHGSLREPLEEYIVDSSTALGTFEHMRWPICFYGHTHVADCYLRREVKSLGLWGQPRSRRELEHAALPNGGRIELHDECLYLLNPGSCGQPRDGNPQARYAIFDSEARTVEVHAVDYDWQAAREAIIAEGLPPVLGDRLGVGR
jgi:diadenosine tetraphosphatase ApaH/serine/threonine PP2A family protein phosphatase